MLRKAQKVTTKSFCCIFLYTGRIITSAVVHNTDLVLSIFGYFKFLQKKGLKIRTTAVARKILQRKLSAPLVPTSISTNVFCVELNCSELSWTTSADAVVFIKVNCISTEFTQKKHGGEKGAGFRLQVDAYKEDPLVQSGMGYAPSTCLQASSCQIRVFKVPQIEPKRVKSLTLCI